MNEGQRYDVIVTADQAAVADNFWMRAIPQSACSDVENADDVRAIVTYGTAADPETSAWEYDQDECIDETDNLVPYVTKTVGTAVFDDNEEASFTTVDSLFKWTLNSTSMLVDWANPTLEMVLDEASTFETDDAVIRLDNANEWVYLAINTDLAIDHPIHLHGHDFFVLAQGEGTYSSDVTLNLDNPPRRDTAVSITNTSGWLEFLVDLFFNRCSPLPVTWLWLGKPTTQVSG